MQREVIQRLAILLEANPSNKRALCQMQVIAFLLRLCPRFNEAILGNYLELVHTLGSYDITAQEVRLLFELALLRFDRVDFALFASFFSFFSNPRISRYRWSDSDAKQRSMVPANRPRDDNVLISRAMHSVDKRIHASNVNE